MDSSNRKTVTGKFRPALTLAAVAICISVLTRIILMIAFSRQTGFPAAYAGSFFIGLLYDLVTATFIIMPFVFQIAFTNNFIYSRPGKIVMAISIAVISFVIFFTGLVPKDYNKYAYLAVLWYLFLRMLIYLILCFAPQSFRFKWRGAVLQIALVIVIFLLLYNAVSEYFFWLEFSGRYNFIAVDYLVYTGEVLGNIRESYPVTAITIIIAIITGIVWWFYFRKSTAASVRRPLIFYRRLFFTAVCFVLMLCAAFLVNPSWVNFSRNNYANEMAGNGMYQFVQAFKNNELDFYKFYKQIPESAAANILHTELSSPHATFTSNDVFNIERQISYDSAGKKMNVVLISVESLSGSFMKAFGNTQNITPNLDSLAEKSIFFTNFYAAGTRTVRGLEAISLSVPPLPGQSLVKRPGNENLFSIGSVFKSKGYTTQFLYGGYAYFDNMEYFFSHNGYEVIDRNALKPSEIHYANIWGVADEDLFALALRTMDANEKKGRPFFSHIMTVSNHRPFTYPDGRIDIPSSSQSREGGVKYTDYAIGKFLHEASAKPWYANTIFVIVADHCASSAGSRALPVTGYHIPMIIFSPAFLQPQKATMLSGQLDIAPTILGLLQMNYKTKFYGRDVFNDPSSGARAFISTYQGLGFIKDSLLVVQSPLKQVKSFRPDFNTGNASETKAPDSIVNAAIAFYQSEAYMFRQKKNK